MPIKVVTIHFFIVDALVVSPSCLSKGWFIHFSQVLFTSLFCNDVCSNRTTRAWIIIQMGLLFLLTGMWNFIHMLFFIVRFLFGYWLGISIKKKIHKNTFAPMEMTNVFLDENRILKKRVKLTKREKTITECSKWESN